MNTRLTMPIARVVEDMHVQVNVTGVKAACLRWWLGSKLMMISAWAWGCHMDVEIGSKPWLSKRSGGKCRICSGYHGGSDSAAHAKGGES